MNFEKLQPKDFSAFKKILSGKYNNSESSLTNMYIWQHYYQAQYCVDDGIIYTIYKNRNSDRFQAFMPYGDARNSISVVDKLVSYFKSNFNTNLTINLATDDFIEFLKKQDKYKFEYKEVPNSFDYVYYVEDLINLKGKKYHSKKNNYNSFVKKYDFEYIRYSDKYKKDCIQFCAKVLEKHHGDDKDSFSNEMTSIIKAFDNLEELNLKCSLICVDKKIVALSVGEQLNSNYALIHIEKADYEYRNAYPVINRLMLQNEFSNLKYVNREEDLGIEGLRIAKQSYLPCKMIKKYIINFLE